MPDISDELTARGHRRLNAWEGDVTDSRAMRILLLDRRRFAVAFLALATAAAVRAQAPVEYRLSFPAAVHHVMQVEVTFRELPPGPLQIRMSRSSPGRYAAFDFARNVFAERITDGDGNAITAARPNPHEWDVAGHNGTVHITYSVFGDRVDGTFLAVDTTHAHLNFPATLMWARGLADRPARVTFVLPPGSGWKIATQLYPTNNPLTFTAPNLTYLMDSASEVSNFAMRNFTVRARDPGGKTQTLRIAMHHLGTDAELDAYVAGFEKIVREEQAIFGELPDFEPGYYTLLADYLPWAEFDGMEHRNSTVLTSRSALTKTLPGKLRETAHEFFHCWNVKRIRPAALEPFNFEDANISGDLWLAEGFTNYYGRLVMVRSGISDPVTGITSAGGEIGGVISSPGTKFRSAVEMSRLAPFADRGVSPDPDYWANTFVTYYSFGDIIALGLDLTLRARSDSRITLDDFMRAMWRVHGKPAGPAPGLVSKPYTLADVRVHLAEVSGDKAFAADFVRRYIEGTEHIDYAPLLLRAGFVLRRQNAGKATLGPISLVKREDAPLRVVSPTLIGSPAYAAGLDLGDELIAVAGVTLGAPDDLSKAIASHKAGEEVELFFKRRGQEVRAKATLAEDPQLEMVPVEKTGGTLTDEQRRFRDAWLNSKAAAPAPH
jgi:predicted metalloprotease with PDZ domain